MAERGVDIRIRMANARTAARDTDRVGKSVRGLGGSADRARKRFQLFNKGLDRTNSLFHRGVKLAGTWIAGVAAFEGIKGVVDTTEAFAHSTIRLNRAMGLTVPQASKLAAALSVRNIPVTVLTTAWNRNAKTIEAARKSWKKGGGAFRDLGISQAEVFKHGSNANDMLRLEAERLNKIRDPTKRAVLGQQLFGRTWTKLLPILGKGAKGYDDVGKMADKYGVTLDGKTIKSAEDLIAAQREAKYASLGLQLTLGRTLVPAVSKAAEKFSWLVRKVRTGKGGWATFRDTVEDTKDKIIDFATLAQEKLGPFFDFLKRNKKTVADVAAGFALIAGAVKIFGAANKITGAGGAVKVLSKLAFGERGSKRNPMYVIVENMGGGGTDVFGDPRKKGKKPPGKLRRGANKIFRGAKKIGPAAAMRSPYLLAALAAAGVKVPDWVPFIGGQGLYKDPEDPRHMTGTELGKMIGARRTRIAQERRTGVADPATLARQVSGLHRLEELQRQRVTEANTAAYRGYQGIPTIHTTINVDGRKLAEAVHRASKTKKSTR